MTCMPAVERPDEVVSIRLGEAVRKARTLAGDVTQVELANRLDVPANYVSRWENSLRPLSPEQVEQVEQALKLRRGTIWRLAGFVDDGDLLNVSTLDLGAQRAIRAILREFKTVDGDGTDGS